MLPINNSHIQAFVKMSTDITK